MDKVEKLLQLSRVLNSKRKFQKAEKILRSISKHCSTNPLWYYRLAYALMFTNRYKEALDLLEKSLIINKKFPFTYLSLAMLYYWQGKYLKALKTSLKGREYCIQFYPKYSWQFERIIKGIYLGYPFVNSKNHKKSIIHNYYINYDDTADLEHKVKNTSQEKIKLQHFLAKHPITEYLTPQKGIQETGNFLAFILLAKPIFNLDDFLKQYYKDWHTNLNIIEKGNNWLLCQNKNAYYILRFFPEPLPKDDLIDEAHNNYRWEHSLKAAQNHQGYLVVSVADSSIAPDAIENGKEFVRLVSSAAASKYTIGINSLHTIFEPEMYRNLAQMYLRLDLLPVENLVFIGIYKDKHNTLSSYTIGLEAFGKQEMEIIESHKKPKELYYFLLDVANFVIKENIILEEGDTLGFTKDEKIPITESPGLALHGDTLKLSFFGFKLNRGILKYH